MQPDDDAPADTEPKAAAEQEEENPTPRIVRAPFLPPPPEIIFHKPKTARRKQFNAGGAIGLSGHDAGPTSHEDDVGSAGRIGAGLSIGISFGMTIVVCIGIGFFIDKHIPVARPWGTVVMAILGMAAAFMNLIRQSNALLKRKQR